MNLQEALDYWDGLDTDEGLYPELVFVAVTRAVVEGTNWMVCLTHMSGVRSDLRDTCDYATPIDMAEQPVDICRIVSRRLVEWEEEEPS